MIPNKRNTAAVPVQGEPQANLQQLDLQTLSAQPGLAAQAGGIAADPTAGLDGETLFGESTANGPLPAPGQGAEQTYPVMVDGEQLMLTLPQLIEAAGVGLSKMNGDVRLQGAAQNVPGGEVYSAFLQEYPDVKPTDIPPEVWDRASQEGSLVSAYRKYELDQLRAQLAALQKNAQNQKQAVGPATSDGEMTESDPIVKALLG